MSKQDQNQDYKTMPHKALSMKISNLPLEVDLVQVESKESAGTGEGYGICCRYNDGWCRPVFINEVEPSKDGINFRSDIVFRGISLPYTVKWGTVDVGPKRPEGTMIIEVGSEADQFLSRFTDIVIRKAAEIRGKEEGAQIIENHEEDYRPDKDTKVKNKKNKGQHNGSYYTERRKQLKAKPSASLIYRKVAVSAMEEKSKTGPSKWVGKVHEINVSHDAKTNAIVRASDGRIVAARGNEVFAKLAKPTGDYLKLKTLVAKFAYMPNKVYISEWGGSYYAKLWDMVDQINIYQYVDKQSREYYKDEFASIGEASVVPSRPMGADDSDDDDAGSQKSDASSRRSNDSMGEVARSEASTVKGTSKASRSRKDLSDDDESPKEGARSTRLSSTRLGKSSPK